MSFVPGLTNSYDRSARTAAGNLPSSTSPRRPSQAQDFNTEFRTIRTNTNTSYLPREGDVVDPDKLASSSDSNDEEVEHEVKRLARQYSNASTIGENPFEAPEDSAINPRSEKFRARAWTKAMLRFQKESNSAKGRTAGVAFKNLSAYGYEAATDYQKTVGNYPLDLFSLAKRAIGHRSHRINILQDFDGLVRSGEMLVVLGPPGSGCSTFLKTLAGETHGFKLEAKSYLNYQGISYKQMHHDFRGETTYTAEQDVHFPSMTVGETLLFAAEARTPRLIPHGVSRKQYAEHLRDVIMATYGIRHTFNTKVGNDFVRGVSGGERKRVTIAEAALTGAPLQCWDNSTRGLDSANAIEFCKTLKTTSELSGVTAAVAIYQAPQAAYDFFDKVTVLYEGRQIFFGDTNSAKQYFIDMGFECPDRQTDADFLTSMTSPVERIVREGFEGRVPRTPDDFARKWKESKIRQTLMQEIEEYEQAHPIGGDDLKQFQESRKQHQSKHQRPSSPYTISYGAQIKLCLWRGFRRLAADPSLTITQLISNAISALIVSSLFYNLAETTSALRSRASLLFFAVLLNGFASALEILVLYAQRPIVEKHTRYAFYHPSAEAMASILTDIPSKIGNAVAFNLVLYFMTNLRRTPGAFFFFFLISFVTLLVMSALFRTIASVSRSLVQALVPTSILMIALIVYTGFVIPVSDMLGWSRWINYLDPVAYSFESLMINEFSGVDFTCDSYFPPAPEFGDGSGTNQVCATVASVAGQTYVSGDAYLETSYSYYPEHKWRNLGILFVFMFALLACYLAATEFITAKKSKGEVLLFRRGHKPESLKQKEGDLESGGSSFAQLEKGRGHKAEKIANIQKQTAIFQWKDVCYDIKIKKEERRILDHVDGWVKPGTMTALMGVSGAGKTTLLDVLATRTTMGVISGEMLVDGRQRDESFQRKTGYVQQQDLHLETSTVREALNFAALLRQPAAVPKEEKLAYVDEVIKLLDMEEYADAVVGVPGEGLNVEQRKKLTIGVELAAKPQLLLFLDEPTSGLDSQTSWSILDLLEKLMKNGQAILCTIHQPSAMLFQRFDRLLFLAKGGKTVYFGPVGENASTLSAYFERNGASPCPPHANPAEWMLEVIGAAPGSYTDVDWHQTWRDSPEIKEVHAELEKLKEERSKIASDNTADSDTSKNMDEYKEFAAPLATQMWIVLKRVFTQYWRTPSYIYSKLLLCALVGLFIGFSFFKAQNSQQGIQDQLFGIFMLLTLFSQLVQQLMPNFVTQRSLYEARERPSKTYSWKVFMLSNMIVDLPWSLLAAVVAYFCWYYPIGLYNNAIPTDAVPERGALCFLLILAFLWFSSTFAHMVIAAIDTAETAGNIANLIFSLCLTFCGVLVGPTAMPGIWRYTMYYISPFHYLIEALLTDSVGGTDLVCASNEYLQFDPPSGLTCYQYLEEYFQAAGTGYLLNNNATTNCQACSVSSADSFLQELSLDFNNRWRDFGIMFIFIIFNFFAALGLYYVARVPKTKGKKKGKN